MLSPVNGRRKATGFNAILCEVYDGFLGYGSSCMKYQFLGLMTASEGLGVSLDVSGGLEHPDFSLVSSTQVLQLLLLKS